MSQHQTYISRCCLTTLPFLQYYQGRWDIIGIYKWRPWDVQMASPECTNGVTGMYKWRHWDELTLSSSVPCLKPPWTMDQSMGSIEHNVAQTNGVDHETLAQKWFIVHNVKIRFGNSNVDWPRAIHNFFNLFLQKCSVCVCDLQFVSSQ